jgi:hypothetical protein
MRLIKIILLAFSVFFFGCEKDDICAEATPTTPRINIEFFDITQPETTKQVAGLKAFGINNADGSEVAINGEIVSTRNKISLPLNPQDSISKFMLYRDFVDANGTYIGNADFITFNYDTRLIYVSKACGYKANYELQRLELNSDSDPWIVTFEILTTEITNEDETHIKIYL